MKRNETEFKVTNVWADGSVGEVSARVIGVEGNEDVFYHLGHILRPDAVPNRPTPRSAEKRLTEVIAE